MAVSTVDTVFIYPTDTVWGIGASIFSKKANIEIHKIKNSDQTKPLSVLFNSIEQLSSFVNLPHHLSTGFLSSFFKLETTLLLPVSLLSKEIPAWVLAGSDQIGCRCINTSVISNIVSKLQAPITTTSLNLSGDGPITNMEAAKLFAAKYAPSATIITEEVTLSGSPSTLCSLQESGEFKILREGSKCDEVKKLCRLLSA